MMDEISDSGQGRRPLNQSAGGREGGRLQEGFLHGGLLFGKTAGHI